MEASVNERLKGQLDSLDKPYEEIEKETGISRSTWYRLIRPGASIKHEYINRLNSVYGIDPNIILGTESKHHNILLAPSDHYKKAIYPNNETEIDVAEYSIIPYYPIQAEAGGGSVVEEYPEAIPMLFQTQFLKQRIGKPVSSLMLIGVTGDSMYPTYQQGDIIMVDRSSRRPTQDDVYVCRIDDVYVLKRVQLLPGERLKLTSDNDHYDPIEIPAKGNGIKIEGRVCWMCRNM